MGWPYTPYTLPGGRLRPAISFAVLCTSAAGSTFRLSPSSEYKGGTLPLQKGPSAERSQTEDPDCCGSLGERVSSYGR